MSPTSDSYFSTTLEKGLSILKLFDRDHPQISLTDISRKAGINKTSTYRFVNTLVQLGFLKRNSQTKQLRLGPQALLMGHGFIQGFDLLTSIKPIIDQAFKENGVTVDAVLFDGESLLAMYRRESADTLFFRHPLQDKNLHARSMGKAVLSNLPREETIKFIETANLKRHTRKTIVSKDRLLDELEITRIRGYSLNDEEYFPSLISIGAPLKNFLQDKVVGAVSLDFSISNNDIDTIQKDYAGTIKKLANDISEIITASNYSL
jgi:DNA-binding IclR family transcriptional regulator